MRRVEANIPEDYFILTERHIEKGHKIDMVFGNIEGNVNCITPSLLIGQLQHFIASLPSKKKTVKAKKCKKDDISKQLSRAFWKS